MSDQLNGKTCLVSGASGFIGAVLCSELRERGAQVKAIVRAETVGDWDGHFLCKLGENEIPSDSLRDVDIVFHLAGYTHSISESQLDESRYFKTNVDGTHDLLRAAGNEGVERFVYFSSVKAMGEDAFDRLDESSCPNPLSPYGKSKREAEKLVLHGGFIDSPTVLRLPMVYGISEKGNLPRMVNAISKNRFPPIPEIENKRSMVHVDDVVQGALLAATNKNSIRNIYILTDGIDYSTRQLYELICKSLGKKIPKWSVPIFWFNVLARLGSMANSIIGANKCFNSSNYQKLFGNSYYSCEKAKAELGFHPKRTLDNSINNIVSGIQKK